VDSATRPNLTWLLALALAGLTLFVFACGGDRSDPSTDDAGATGHHKIAGGEQLPAVMLPARWAWGDAEQLNTLIGSADVVFRGHVAALKSQRPLTPRPPGAEAGGAAPRWADMPVSRFEVRIERVVAGNLTAATAFFEQLGGVETRPDGTQVRIMLNGDQPIEVGETYLFFGSFQEDGSIVAPPFGRMHVRPNGGLVAEAGWEDLGALAELSRRNLGDAERQISVTAGE